MNDISTLMTSESLEPRLLIKFNYKFVYLLIARSNQVKCDVANFYMNKAFFDIELRTFSWLITRDWLHTIVWLAFWIYHYVRSTDVTFLLIFSIHSEAFASECIENIRRNISSILLLVNVSWTCHCMDVFLTITRGLRADLEFPMITG